jgi:integrase
MARGRINKRTVDALEPIDGRSVLLWDDALPGFGVRCLPSGVKVYHLKYRTRGGRTRWLTLGQHGPVTPDKARVKAMREKAAVVDGADPAGDLAKKRCENTVAEVADRYLAEHAAKHNKTTTAREVRRIVETKIKPKFGSVKITDLTHADIQAWHQAMSATPYEANRALAYCSKMLTLATKVWALRTGLNPCSGIERFPEPKRKRYFSGTELGRLGAALAVEREGAESPCFVLLIRLLATTGMRLSDALRLRWANVDLVDATLNLPDRKAEDPLPVYLGGPAVSILDALPSGRSERSGYVIYDLEPSQPLRASKAEHAWGRLRKQAGITNARLHDLRHTMGTLAGRSGANAFVARDLHGHLTLAMTGRYVHAVGVQATADEVSHRIVAALNAGAAMPAKITQSSGRQ